MLWKVTRQQKILNYSKLLTKIHVLTEEQAVEIMKSIQNNK